MFFKFLVIIINSVFVLRLSFSWSLCFVPCCSDLISFVLISFIFPDQTYCILFYSILFYSILFYSLLFYSILFYSILFYSFFLLIFLYITISCTLFPLYSIDFKFYFVDIILFIIFHLLYIEQITLLLWKFKKKKIIKKN